MQWSDLTNALGTLLVIPITNAALQNPSSNATFNNFLTTLTAMAERRIFSECDFLETRTYSSTVVLSTATRLNTFPVGTIVAQSCNVITPAGDTVSAGTRNPLTITSKEFIDQAWPAELSGQTVPEYIAIINDTQFIVAPTPDQAYTAEFTGIFRPAAISASNPTTYVSLNYPDLLLAACMVVGCAYQKDWGAQSDDPKMAQSWENFYQLSKTSAIDEDQRRKTQGANWSPYSDTPKSSPRAG